jgi:hypothetical protein
MAIASRRVWTPSDLSFLAIILFSIAQVFSYKLISGSKTQIYIKNNRSYMASSEYVGSTGGRSSSAKYRLRFNIATEGGIHSCDVVKLVDIPAAPILTDHIAVTPRPNTCEDPYLTDLEFWPRFEAWLGLSFTALVGTLLIASALWHRRLVVKAIARQSANAAMAADASISTPESQVRTI